VIAASSAARLRAANTVAPGPAHLRRRSLAALRREIESVAPRCWRDSSVVARVGGKASGVDRLLEVVFQLQGLALPRPSSSATSSPVASPTTTRPTGRARLDGEVVWVGVAL